MATKEGEKSQIDILLTIQSQLEDIKSSQKELNQRVETLESIDNSQAQPGGSKSPRDEEIEDDSEESENEGPAEEEDQEEGPMYSFTRRIKTCPVGPPINKTYAEDINLTLIKKTDMIELNKLHEANPSPSNIASLRVPIMNPEVTINPTCHTGQRETAIVAVHKEVTTGLAILSKLIDDVGRKSDNNSLSRQNHFDRLNECITVMAEAHKQITYIRRQNVRHLLKEKLQILCSKKATEDIDTNMFVFGDDMDRQADQQIKKRKVMKAQKFPKSKNGSFRGRGHKKYRDPPSRGGFNQSKPPNPQARGNGRGGRRGGAQ